MGVALQRGYKDKKGLVSKSDESVESERRLESLEAMEAEFTRRLLCTLYGWGNCF